MNTQSKLAQPVTRDDRLAVVYDRASTERQRDNYSRADAARLATLAERYGFSRCEVRQEIKSGESLENRKVMTGILEEIAAGGIGAIICQDFTRLSRDEDGIDGRIIRQTCRDAGCVIITPEKMYDFSLDVDDDLADIGFLIGKIQKRQNVKALVRGMREKALQGKMLPPVPTLGYRWTATTDGLHKAPGADLKVCDEDVPTLQAIFDRYEQMSARKVALSLNAEGRRLRTKQGELRPFRAADIVRIVRNPFYTGSVAWGRNVKSRHLKGFEPVERHDPNLQIISFEQFNRVQGLARRRYWTPPRSVGSPFLLSGVLKCARCGAATVGGRQHKQRNGQAVEWHYYQCRAYNQHGRTACVGTCLSEPVARAAIERFLSRVLSVELDLRSYLNDAAQELVVTNERVSALKADLQEAETALGRIADAVALGALDLDAARSKTLELRERRERAQKRLDAIKAGVALGTDLKQALTLVETDLPQVVATMDGKRFKTLVQLILRRVSVVASGSYRNRQGNVTSYEFTPEFQELWLTLSKGVVELRVRKTELSATAFV